MTDKATTTLRELSHRESDGIEVTLYWSSDTGRLAVFVSDERTGDQFAIDVGSDDPLDVFRHPFAYACRRVPELVIPWPARENALAA